MFHQRREARPENVRLCALSDGARPEITADRNSARWPNLWAYKTYQHEKLAKFVGLTVQQIAATREKDGSDRLRYPIILMRVVSPSMGRPAQRQP